LFNNYANIYRIYIIGILLQNECITNTVLSLIVIISTRLLRHLCCQPFIENGGSLLGLLLLLCWRRHDLPGNLAVLAAMDGLVGILALHVPEMSSYAWAVAYSAIYGFTDGRFIE